MCANAFNLKRIILFFFKYIKSQIFLECCQTIVLSSDSPSFASYNAFGVGTYIFDSVDSRDRNIYRNTYWNSFGLGDFILRYEGSNPGGRKNWLVCIPKYIFILVNELS